MCSTTNPGNELGLTEKDHACTCGTDAHASAPAVVSENAIREHYFVDGMTCNHCVSSVTEEVSALDGVDSVSVDLNAGGTSKVMIVSSKPIPAEDIRTAITEAGYSLVSA